MKIKKRNETPDKKWTLGNRIVTKKSASINVRITAGFCYYTFFNFTFQMCR